MKRDEVSDYLAFMAVAEQRSFTRAAAQLGTSQSSLSHLVKRLEGRLGLRLLTRTTRSVAPTDAGERLLETLRPAFNEIDARVDALSALRDKPAGLVRITTGLHAAQTLLWPAVAKLLPNYPEIKLEISTDQALTNLVEGRFDAGVRLGEHVARDMVAVRIGPDLRFAIVASPAYFKAHPRPKTPQELSGHDCINLRFPTRGGLYAWEFEKAGREINVRVEGSLIFNDMRQIIQAALDGFGIALTMEDEVKGLIAEKRLVRVLDDWCQPFAGYHLYYPSRRQLSPAFQVLVDALKYRQR
jgi:DNA-binding transcriptional LysR family regulator